MKIKKLNNLGKNDEEIYEELLKISHNKIDSMIERMKTMVSLTPERSNELTKITKDKLDRINSLKNQKIFETKTAIEAIIDVMDSLSYFAGQIVGHYLINGKLENKENFYGTKEIYYIRQMKAKYLEEEYIELLKEVSKKVDLAMLLLIGESSESSISDCICAIKYSIDMVKENLKNHEITVTEAILLLKEYLVSLDKFFNKTDESVVYCKRYA